MSSAPQIRPLHRPRRLWYEGKDAGELVRPWVAVSPDEHGPWIFRTDVKTAALREVDHAP